MSFSRSPATAAAGSGVLIVTALVGVVLAAGSAAEPAASAAAAAASAPAGLNGAPLVLPSACPPVRLRQPCDAVVTRPRHTKARRHAAPPIVPTPTAGTPSNPAQP